MELGSRAWGCPVHLRPCHGLICVLLKSILDSRLSALPLAVASLAYHGAFDGTIDAVFSLERVFPCTLSHTTAPASPLKSTSAQPSVTSPSLLPQPLNCERTLHTGSNRSKAQPLSTTAEVLPVVEGAPDARSAGPAQDSTGL